MNILVLTPVFPYPPGDGDRLRIFNLIKQMTKENKIYLISFIRKGEEKYINELNKYCKKITVVYISKAEIILNSIIALFLGKPLNVFSYYKSEMQKKIDGLLKENKIDIIFSYRIRMAQYVKDIKVPKVLDMVDSLAYYMKNRLKFEKNIFSVLYLLIDYFRVLKYEKKLTREFNYVFLNYEKDKEFLGSDKIIVIPNGVDFDVKTKKIKKEKNKYKIGFFGDFRYAPNLDGINYFYKKVWKNIKVSGKNIELILAGKKSEELKIKDDKIIKKGFIEKIDEEIMGWDICIAPVRYGAGRQNKILKAWLNCVPVVATSFAAEGVYGKDGYNLLIADTEKEFANKILFLINKKKMVNKIIKNADYTLKKYFNWNNSGKILNKILRSLK